MLKVALMDEKTKALLGMTDFKIVLHLLNVCSLYLTQFVYNRVDIFCVYIDFQN